MTSAECSEQWIPGSFVSLAPRNDGDARHTLASALPGVVPAVGALAEPFARFGMMLVLAVSVITPHEVRFARAETGDAHISIHYRTKSVRVRPAPRTGGADVDFGIVLHDNGTVADSFSVKGGHHGSSNAKLGPASRGPVYRVLNSGTFIRTVDLGTHYHKMAVRTSGKNCTADVEFILKPGVQEYRDYSTQLKTMAYYSSLSVEYITCVIE